VAALTVLDRLSQKLLKKLPNISGTLSDSFDLPLWLPNCGHHRIFGIVRF